MSQASMWRNLGRITQRPSFNYVSCSGYRAICSRFNHNLAHKTKFIQDVSIIPTRGRHIVRHFKALNSYGNDADLVIDGEISTQDLRYFEQYEIELILADVYGLSRVSVDSNTSKELQESKCGSEVIKVLSNENGLGTGDCLLALSKLVAFNLENVTSGTTDTQAQSAIHAPMSQNILKRIENVYEEMTCSELISCLLGLHHLQVPCNNEVVAKILRLLKLRMSTGMYTYHLCYSNSIRLS